MMNRRWMLGLWVAGLALATGAAPAQSPAPAPPDRVYGAQVVKTYPHDPGAFTEGLLFEKGALFESTGLVGRSWIRKSKLETGQVLLQRELKGPYFGEGMVTWKDKVVQLTWQHQVGFIYGASDFAPRGAFKYKGEGWALTKDDRHLIMSDGTDELRFLNPDTLAETGRLKVTYRGRPLRNINELEWVKGEIFANIWQTPIIVRIDPRTGVVTGRIDASNLPAGADRNGAEDVLNGIAYDAAGDRLLITGKQWSKIYEIKLAERKGG